jgi:cytochrome c-type biogenesis protein
MQALLDMLKETISGGGILVYPVVFIGGLVASVTPCTYPVLPLTVGYIGAQSDGSKKRAMLLSGVMVLSMAVIYALLGIIFAAMRKPMGSLQGNGMFLTAIAVFFILMSLFLLDAFRFPDIGIFSKLQSKAGNNKGVLGAIAVGGVSGLVVGPCTGPILAAVLALVTATLKDASGTAYLLQILDGGFKLFLFGLGQGALIFLCGSFSGLLGKLPKAGQWMVNIKKGFAGIMLASACLLLLYTGHKTGFDPLDKIITFFEGDAKDDTNHPLTLLDGPQAPTISLLNQDNQRFDLSASKGKEGVLLVFFTTYCANCMKEVPEVIDIAEMAAKRKVRVMAVNVQQSLDVVKSFRKEKSVNYNVLLDSNGEVAKSLDISGVPVILGIDATGKIRYRQHVLPSDYSGLLDALETGVQKTQETQETPDDSSTTS